MQKKSSCALIIAFINTEDLDSYSLSINSSSYSRYINGSSISKFDEFKIIYSNYIERFNFLKKMIEEDPQLNKLLE